ncbi:peptidoglycan DD-metalloendopeptidase family protein [Streptomyces wuyuanensis]|uniref:peptidoglycan DD-metalloendopeptidase family protein n=1 Tax=Streptomyces wuyuanensis TaxID=1196353 RepID=UPI003F54084F
MNRGRRVVTTALVAALLVLVCPVAARAAVWPVGPPRPAVVRGWEPPPSPYGRGHRGVDLTAPPGTEVRAAAAGRVSFAGPVAGRGVLSIELAGTGDPPLRTTYEPVRPLVAEGALVGEGEAVAVVAEGPAHCPRGCLHWGLRRGAEYLDPLSLLPASALRRGPSRLLPVFGVPRSAEPPGAAARRLADTAAAPSRAGADAVQALILVAAAVLSRRALRHRREGVIRRSGRRCAVCGGAWRRTPALRGRRWATHARAWGLRTRAWADSARQSRIGGRGWGGGAWCGGGGRRQARGAWRGQQPRADPTRQSQAQGGGRRGRPRAAGAKWRPRAGTGLRERRRGSATAEPDAGWRKGGRGARHASKREAAGTRATPGAGHARAPGRRGAGGARSAGRGTGLGTGMDPRRGRRARADPTRHGQAPGGGRALRGASRRRRARGPAGQGRGPWARGGGTGQGRPRTTEPGAGAEPGGHGG